MSLLTVRYSIVARVPIASLETRLLVDDGTQFTGTLSEFIAARRSKPETSAQTAHEYEDPAPGLDPVTGEPENLTLIEVKSPLSFYLFDHLGNTRVTFRADAADAISITYAADYYPYGKVLRQYKECNQNRYLSTHHERDKDTGYDNRGARLYDSEIGRFLGVDPLAGEMPGWSPYNYVMGNPISLVDPDGRMPSGPGDPPSNLYDDFKSDVIGAWNKFTSSIQNLVSGTDSQHEEAVRYVRTVEAGTNALVKEFTDAGFESARTTTQGVGQGAEVVEMAALATTVGTGGLSGEVSLPIAGAADMVGTVALLTEGGIDLLQEGRLRPETKQSLGLKLLFGTGGKVLGNFLEKTLKNSPQLESDAVQGVAEGGMKILEATTPVVIDRVKNK